MSLTKSVLLNITFEEVNQWDESRLEDVMKELNIEKNDSWNKEAMANEVLKEIKSHKSLINDDIESANEEEFLIDKVCLQIK